MIRGLGVVAIFHRLKHQHPCNDKATNGNVSSLES